MGVLSRRGRHREGAVLAPTPVDNGPYLSEGQTMAQYDAAASDIPWAMPVMVIRDSLMRSGVEVSEFESQRLTDSARGISAAQAQIIAGWIARAHLTGRDAGFLAGWP